VSFTFFSGSFPGGCNEKYVLVAGESNPLTQQRRETSQSRKQGGLLLEGLLLDGRGARGRTYKGKKISAK